MSRIGQLGTTAFDYSMMNETIRFDKLSPNVMELSIWFQFIPEIFREGAIKIVKKIGNDVLYLPDKEAKERFITSFQLEIDNAISKRELTRWGWK